MIRIFIRLVRFKFRKRRRYKTRKGIFVTFDNVLSKNQISDISMGGLSYYYADHGFTMGMRAQAMRVLTADDHTCIDHIPFSIISDREVGSLIFKNKCIKRQGIRFGTLTRVQKRMIKKIIRNCTHASPGPEIRNGD